MAVKGELSHPTRAHHGNDNAADNAYLPLYIVGFLAVRHFILCCSEHPVICTCISDADETGSLVYQNYSLRWIYRFKVRFMDDDVHHRAQMHCVASLYICQD